MSTDSHGKITRLVTTKTKMIAVAIYGQIETIKNKQTTIGIDDLPGYI
jgi:hypothetical protein